MPAWLIDTWPGQCGLFSPSLRSSIWLESVVLRPDSSQRQRESSSSDPHPAGSTDRLYSSFSIQCWRARLRRSPGKWSASIPISSSMACCKEEELGACTGSWRRHKTTHGNSDSHSWYRAFLPTAKLASSAISTALETFSPGRLSTESGFISRLHAKRTAEQLCPTQAPRQRNRFFAR